MIIVHQEDATGSDLLELWDRFAHLARQGHTDVPREFHLNEAPNSGGGLIANVEENDGGMIEVQLYGNVMATIDPEDLIDLTFEL